MDAEYIAYLQKENSDLKDEIKLYQDKLNIAIEALKKIKSYDNKWRCYINRMLMPIRTVKNK